MKTCIVYYSMSGNNENLAIALADELKAELIMVEEFNKRSMMTIIIDMIFGRIPNVTPKSSVVNRFEKVIFVAPVWMESPASPLRAYFREIKKSNRSYSFISISGGALNDNPKLINNVKKFAGDNLDIFKDMHISSLLNKEKITKKDISSYKLNDNDIKLLMKQLLSSFK